jgi:hypothetical protein
MCSHQHWMLVIGVLSLGVGSVLGKHLCLAVGLTMTMSLGAIFLFGEVCRCTLSSLDVDLAGEITAHVGWAATACLRRVTS